MFSTVLGGFGEVLITLGVLGMLFVAWELWWTGIDAERDRQESAEEYYAGLEEYRPGSEDEEIDFDVCYTLEDGTEIGCAPSMNDLADGVSTMGMAYVPRLGEDWATPIRHGTGPEQIDRGALGHYTTTQMPDEPGNFALAGHRQTNGNMLGNQDDLQTGDRIYIEAAEGIFVYEVAEREVVLPHETRVLEAVPSEAGAEPESGVLTFTTCHPLFSNAERLIHHAEITDFIPYGGQAPEEIDHHLQASGWTDDDPLLAGEN
ncbi:hypothetical protein GCM10028800_19880 [Nesterenkonia populi]